MSRYFWSLSAFAEKKLSNIQDNVTTATNSQTLREAPSPSISIKQEVISDDKPADNSPGKTTIPTLQSKRVQTNNQYSVQNPEKLKKKENKSTSFHCSRKSDRGTVTSNNVTKTDVGTDPVEQKTCHRHRSLFRLISKWHLQKADVDEKQFQPSLVKQLNHIFKVISNSLQMNKIQTVPRYDPPQKEMIKLFTRKDDFYDEKSVKVTSDRTEVVQFSEMLANVT